MRPWAWMLGAALATFYAARLVVGLTASSHLAALAGVAVLAWRWEREYSSANEAQ